MIQTFSRPTPIRRGSIRHFKTLIELGPSTDFSWPVVVPMPAGSLPVLAKANVSATALACRIVLQLTGELTSIFQNDTMAGRDFRRTQCHIQQIAMYICHVILRLSLSDIGSGFGKHRTTVSYACQVVEDRRDNAGFEQFVSMVERIVLSVFNPGEDCDDL